MSVTLEQLAAIESDIVSHVVVEATAGAGKTFSISHRIKYLLENGIQDSNILVCTFSKSQSEDMTKRILNFLKPFYPEVENGAFCHGFSPSNGQITTIHASARRMLINYPQYSKYSRLDIAPDYKSRAIIEKYIEEVGWKWFNPRTKKIELIGYQSVLWYINEAKNAGIDWNFDSLFQHFSVMLPDEAFKLAKAAVVYNRELQKANLWTFACMMYECEQAFKNDKEFQQYWHNRFTHLIIDEGQDTNNQAMRIVRLLDPVSLFIVGDSDQCVPVGTPILVNNNEAVSVENLSEHGFVLSGKGQGNVRLCEISHISQRFHTGETITLKTENGFSVTVTDNHPIIATLPYMYGIYDGRRTKKHYVYLMYKKGMGYRVGKSQNLIQRLNSEHAHKLWILEEYEDDLECRIQEARIAATYGLPTEVFQYREEGFNGHNQKSIDRLYSLLDTETPAKRLMNEYNLTFPHLVRKNGEEKIRVRAIIGADSKHNVACVETSNTEFWEKVESTLKKHNIKKTVGKRGTFRSRFYGNADTVEQVVIDIAFATDNIPSFTYALWNNAKYFNGDHTMHPTTYRADTIIVGMYVPVLNKEGEIVPDRVVEVIKESVIDLPVYDLSVPRFANFIANGVVIHNCLYRFNNATPTENLREGFDEYFKGTRYNISTNFRSQPKILSSAERLIRNNYTAETMKYFKPLNPREGVEDGMSPDFHWFKSPEDEADYIVSEMESAITSGQTKPGDYIIQGRLNAQTAYYELRLLQKKIPFVNLGMSSFFNRPVPRILINYIRLCVDRGNFQAFEQIHNIASCYMTKKDGSHSPTRYLGAKFLAKLNAKAKDLIEETRIHKNDLNDNNWAQWKKGAQDLLDTMIELGSWDENNNAGALASEIVRVVISSWIDSEYGVESDSSDGARDDLAVVLDIASRFSIKDFISYIDTLQKTKDVKPEDLKEYVLIGTIYRFKGLERNIVYIIGCSERILPHRFSLGEACPSDGLPIPSISSVWDERNVMFVGITRAAQECHLTGTATWPTIKESLEPSRFISEMGLIFDESLIEKFKEDLRELGF